MIEAMQEKHCGRSPPGHNPARSPACDDDEASRVAEDTASNHRTLDWSLRILRAELTSICHQGDLMSLASAHSGLGRLVLRTCWRRDCSQDAISDICAALDATAGPQLVHAEGPTSCSLTRPASYSISVSAMSGARRGEGEGGEGTIGFGMLDVGSHGVYFTTAIGVRRAQHIS
eukprot:scaffold549_cov385-Prasinococcus_capsulatus_cf.AAC.45